MAWPHPAPIVDCWAPGSAGRPPELGSEMPQGLGAPLLQLGTLQGPGALALEDWAPGAGLGGLAESKGSETQLPLCYPQCSPSLLALSPAGAMAGVHTVLALTPHVCLEWAGATQQSHWLPAYSLPPLRPWGSQTVSLCPSASGVQWGFSRTGPRILNSTSYPWHGALSLSLLTGWLWGSCFPSLNLSVFL